MASLDAISFLRVLTTCKHYKISIREVSDFVVKVSPEKRLCAKLGIRTLPRVINHNNSFKQEKYLISCKK